MQTNEISVADAARLLGVRVDEVYRLCISGKLRARKVPISASRKRWWINLADIEQRIAKRTNGRG